MEIDGHCDARFDGVRQAFASNFDELGDIGASVAATVDDESVVDLWGGTCATDAGPGRPWQRDTIINVWSTTKTMSFLVTLMLADRGLLDLDAPVADVWPEFATGGKDRIDTKHVLSHSAGLSGFDVMTTAHDLTDHDLVCGRLAAQSPWWEPGTASGYHAVTQGYLLGEIARRVGGRSMGRFLADEVTGPLDADFHIGTAAEHDDRVAHVDPPPNALGGDLAPGTIAHRTFATLPLDASASQTHEWRRAEIPAAGGHGNARSVARVMSVLANGGSLDGRQFLSAAMCDRIFEEQQHGNDLVLDRPLRLGLGFGLSSDDMPLPNDRCCFWGGWGGSLALVDMEHRVSFSYVMNDMRESTTGDDRAGRLLMALYGSLAAEVG